MSNITLTIPNDDHIALRAFGKALEEMALAHGAEPRKTTAGELSYKINIDTTEATAALGELRQHCTVELNDQQQEQLREKLKVVLGEPEFDTTAQQVESLAVPGATHIITERKLVGDPEPVGDDNFSQGYIATVEEIADPVDSTGTPWDERIHSTSKALNADGTWRLRRKPKDVDEAEWAATVQKVQDEWRFPQEPIAVTPVMTDEEVKAFDGVEPPVTPPGDDFHTDVGVVTEQTVAGIPPIPVPPVATGAMLDALAEIPVAPPLPHTIPAPVADEAWDFPKLMKFLTERHGKIDVPTVNQLLAVDGLAALTDLNAHPDKIGPFVTRVKAHLGE